jgi:hypothetical protein
MDNKRITDNNRQAILAFEQECQGTVWVLRVLNDEFGPKITVKFQ